MRELRGKVAVITGGAGGIGRALAVELAAQGCALALADKRPAELEETAALVRGTTKVTTHVTDVTRREDILALREQVLAAHGAVHVVITCAGLTMVGLFDTFSPEQLDQVLAVNLHGTMNTCHAFIPALKRAGEGHLVTISSMLGLVGMPTQSTYALTKFAVRGLSESLRGELSPFGVGVTVVFPGATRTPMLDHAEGPLAEASRPMLETSKRHALDPATLARRVRRAIQRDSPRVVSGADGRLFDWISRLAPGFIASAASRMVKGLLPKG